MSVFDHSDFDGHEEVHFIDDSASGLRAVIALHSTRLGPAIGGCRVWRYHDTDAALADVLRLSRGMTYKAATAGVPFGGGKAVVLVDANRTKSREAMLTLGRTIEQLGGRYVTGEDVGTTSEDMATIRAQTRHVMGMPPEDGGSGDPSPSTALGCFYGVRAAVRRRLDRRARAGDLAGLRVAVQGVGNVGWNLCKLLRDAGARLVVADVMRERAERAALEFDAALAEPHEIHCADVDVFSPCALGATLNDNTLRSMKAVIVAGGANNQLAQPQHDHTLRELGILYAPDFVINAGGMIQLAMERLGTPQQLADRVSEIGSTLTRVFELAEVERLPTGLAAERVAQQRLQGAPA